MIGLLRRQHVPKFSKFKTSTANHNIKNEHSDIVLSLKGNECIVCFLLPKFSGYIWSGIKMTFAFGVIWDQFSLFRSIMSVTSDEELAATGTSHRSSANTNGYDTAAADAFSSKNHNDSSGSSAHSSLHRNGQTLSSKKRNSTNEAGNNAGRSASPMRRSPKNLNRLKDMYVLKKLGRFKKDCIWMFLGPLQLFPHEQQLIIIGCRRSLLAQIQQMMMNDSTTWSTL